MVLHAQQTSPKALACLEAAYHSDPSPSHPFACSEQNSWHHQNDALMQDSSTRLREDPTIKVKSSQDCAFEP
jgi:hypothetical protein